MGSICLCIIVCTFSFICSAWGSDVGVVEYERTRSCNFTQECVYKYTSTQYSFGKKHREEMSFSADVQWHCESSGLINGNLPASEYCLTLSNAIIGISAGNGANSTVNYTTNNGHGGKKERMAAFIEKSLKGKFCYLQSDDGKMVSIHYSPTDDHEGINIKRGIASAFQANFENKTETEESDPGSLHVSHYSYSKTSDHVVMFTRSIKSADLIDISGGAPRNSLDYIKLEKSTFIDKVLYKSSGVLKARVDFGHGKSAEPSSSKTFNPNIDFGEEFQANGTYEITKMYCSRRHKRSFSFADLSNPNVHKGNIKAVIDLASFNRHRIREMRGSIPSIIGILERLRRNPNNTQLAFRFRQLIALEAKYGTPEHHTPAIVQLIGYYKMIQDSSKLEDVEIRKLLYSFLSSDSSAMSQEVLASALKKNLNQDEKDALLHQLTQMNKANSDLVNTLISLNSSNDDNMMLVLGALARDNSEAIQTIVVSELLRRVENSTDINTITTITYALGNTGSKLALNALLFSLGYDIVDIKISAVRSLKDHVDLPVVQECLIVLLASMEEDKLLEEVLLMLINAFNNEVLTNPSEELINATVSSAIKLENPNLYELLIIYLHKTSNKNANTYVESLRKQIKPDTVSSIFRSERDSRIKRGSGWDEVNSNYDVVASYSQRRSDVTTYPYHRGYIWERNFGASKLRLRVGAGAFAGAYYDKNTDKQSKVFAKYTAVLELFDKTFSVADLEFSDVTSGTNLTRKKYAKFGQKVYLSNSSSFTLGNTCRERSNTLWDESKYEIFNVEFPIPVYIGTVGVYITGYVGSKGDSSAKNCACSKVVHSCADAKLSLSLTVGGGADASFLYLVRGGIEVSATLDYYIEPDLCAQKTATISQVRSCALLYHGWDIHINIFPWWQTRDWTLSWGTKHHWDPLSYSWKTYENRKKLWKSCPSFIDNYPCGGKDTASKEITSYTDQVLSLQQKN